MKFLLNEVSRSCKEAESKQVAEFLHEAVQIALEIQQSSGKLMKDFVAALGTNDKVKDLKKRVEQFAHSLPMPGFDPASVAVEYRH